LLQQRRALRTQSASSGKLAEGEELDFVESPMNLHMATPQFSLSPTPSTHPTATLMADSSRRSLRCSSARSAAAPSCIDAVLEMTCDLLCIRTMTVSYIDRHGTWRQYSQTGYNVKIFLPVSVRGIVVTFSVVGGSAVYRVDRSQRDMPWVKDESGSFMAESFSYEIPPEYVQFFVRGPSLHSYVARVDERRRSENLLEMVSRDFQCVRTLHVSYTDTSGTRQNFSGTGYSVSCHLPSSACDVEVTFTAFGGRPVNKVDRRDPSLPWVQDANGQSLPESFLYTSCPQCVQYEIRGAPWQAYISQVYEQRPRSSVDAAIPTSSSCGGLRSKEDGPELFDVAPHLVPAIGGIVGLSEPHSEYLLPPEVLLFEPSAKEIHHRGNEDKPGSRQIFLNTPLMDFEVAALREFRQVLVKRDVIAAASDRLPRCIETHALRMLQTCKYDAGKAADMMRTFVSERVRRLPLAEEDVREDLRNGFIYWHGRDRQCRPCLIIRLERLGEMARDKERAVRAVIFTLEYALRFAMVPGRVENWVVIIDLHNVLSVISPLHIASMTRTAAAIGTTLEKVFCSRMVWIKIINMPGSSVLTRAINGLIPADKRDKISFPDDARAALRKCFEPNQLEERYGGTAADLKPEDTYPYNFFPNPRGQAAHPSRPSEDTQALADGTPHSEEATSSNPHCGAEDCSMHEWTSLCFHEGYLWDRSFPAVQERWVEAAAELSLAPLAAAALAEALQDEVSPCREMSQWMELMNPRALNTQCTMRAYSCSFSSDVHEQLPLARAWRRGTGSELAEEDVVDAEEATASRLPASALYRNKTATSLRSWPRASLSHVARQ